MSKFKNIYINYIYFYNFRGERGGDYFFLNLLRYNVVVNVDWVPSVNGAMAARCVTAVINLKYLENTANRIRTKNNIIAKLAGTKWRAIARTLRTSALELVYSATEYCAPVLLLNSKHCNKIDIQLNQTMRTIPEPLKSTALAWLLAVKNISPRSLRRKEALRTEWNIYLDNLNLKIRLIIDFLPYI